jgi:hypothetical protein
MRTVYVYCYRGVASGGPEAIHQLAHELSAQGVEARLVSLPETVGWPEVEAYAGYGCAWADSAPDSPESVVVVPEVAMSVLSHHQQSQRVVWWLSVDHAEVYTLARWKNPRRIRRVLAGAHHVVQSAYALDVVTGREGLPAEMLSDYVSTSTGSPGVVRPGSVAYNPARGEELTAAVRALAPDLDWRPIEGLDRAGVDALLRSTAVYLDLGNHPGKDRIPREAALAGCVVVVGRTGSAAYDADVPIPEHHKVPLTDDPTEVAARVVPLLRSVLADRAPQLAAQARYREAIGRERDVFSQEVASFVRSVVKGVPS